MRRVYLLIVIIRYRSVCADARIDRAVRDSRASFIALEWTALIAPWQQQADRILTARHPWGTETGAATWEAPGSSLPTAAQLIIITSSQQLDAQQVDWCNKPKPAYERWRQNCRSPTYAA